MATLTITLPDDRAQFLREQAEARGATIEAYLDAVLGDLQARAASKKRLEALLIEGLESGPMIPVTPETWDEIRHEAKRRREARPRTA